MKKFLLVCLLTAIISPRFLAQTQFVCDGVNLETVNDSCVYVIGFGNYKYSGNVVIPEEATYQDKTYRVTGIASKAFASCTSLLSIQLPSSLQIIESAAFQYCSNLKTITLPENLKEIKDFAFFYCTKLSSIIIPNSVTKIGGSAFDRCEAMTSIKIGTGLTVINASTFGNCYNLTSVKIPANVKSIKRNAFCECRKLSTVTIESKETQYDIDAFNKTPYYVAHSKRTNITVGGRTIPKSRVSVF